MIGDQFQKGDLPLFILKPKVSAARATQGLSGGTRSNESEA